ncbi:MAG TPA: GGDEF domain-containing protein, partial [Acidimicrobiales bacterium]|nr:GGDEF domain-containing protein [Acidimicrobiales bacterium]
GRLGGDEFAVLLPETDHRQAHRVARRFQEAVRAAATAVPVTVSFGTASWTGPSDLATEVLRRADRALYAAKDAGRDRLVAWEPGAELVSRLHPEAGAPARGLTAPHPSDSDALRELPGSSA